MIAELSCFFSWSGITVCLHPLFWTNTPALSSATSYPWIQEETSWSLRCYPGSSVRLHFVSPLIPIEGKLGYFSALPPLVRSRCSNFVPEKETIKDNSQRIHHYQLLIECLLFFTLIVAAQLFLFGVLFCTDKMPFASQYLEQLRDSSFDSNCVLVFIDVSPSYINIRNNQTLQAVSEMSATHVASIEMCRLSISRTILIKECLKCTIFKCSVRYFSQIQGPALHLLH